MEPLRLGVLLGPKPTMVTVDQSVEMWWWGESPGQAGTGCIGVSEGVLLKREVGVSVRS